MLDYMKRLKVTTWQDSEGAVMVAPSTKSCHSKYMRHLQAAGGPASATVVFPPGKSAENFINKHVPKKHAALLKNRHPVQFFVISEDFGKWLGWGAETVQV
jgi:hypothetical protein